MSLVILGVGMDVCSIERVEGMLTRWGDRFWERVLGPAERVALAQRSDRATALAGRFAAKEALAKAMQGGVGIGWHDLEVRGAPKRAPEFVLHGPAKALAEHVGVTRVHVSISHDAGIAVAIVILEGEPTGGSWR